jgi:hypothetical protein
MKMAIAENAMPQKSDYGTPPEIAQAVTALLGAIDLDPCSSAEFNKLVGATYIYTEADNGLDQTWGGRVYLNPPGGKAKPRAKAWWQRLVDEYESGVVHSAVYMSFALDSFQWSQAKGVRPVIDYPTVVFAKRVKFYVVEGGEATQTKAPTRPCALTWLPPKVLGTLDRGLIKAFEGALGQVGHACRAILPA